MSEARQHLGVLRDQARDLGKISGDEVIGKMIPELAALLVTLSEDMDRSQGKVIRLTWALLVLTVLLAVITLVPLIPAPAPVVGHQVQATEPNANTKKADDQPPNSPVIKK